MTEDPTPPCYAVPALSVLLGGVCTNDLVYGTCGVLLALWLLGGGWERYPDDTLAGLLVELRHWWRGSV